MFKLDQIKNINLKKSLILQIINISSLVILILFSYHKGCENFISVKDMSDLIKPGSLDESKNEL